MPRPVDSDSARTYDTILNSALSILQEVPNPMDLSLRGVASRAGLSLGTLQYYFASKEALLESCLDAYYERLAGLSRSLIQTFTSAPPGWNIIEESVRSFYRFACAERALIRVRLALNLLRGELSPRRQSEYYGGMLQEAAAVLAPFVTVESLDARMSIHTLMTLIVRMALSSEAEIQLIVGEGGEAGQKQIEEYLVRAAKRLLQPAAN